MGCGTRLRMCRVRCNGWRWHLWACFVIAGIILSTVLTGDSSRFLTSFRLCGIYIRLAFEFSSV
jgi:hypothetical protein